MIIEKKKKEKLEPNGEGSLVIKNMYSNWAYLRTVEYDQIYRVPKLVS